MPVLTFCPSNQTLQIAFRKLVLCPLAYPWSNTSIKVLKLLIPALESAPWMLLGSGAELWCCASMLRRKTRLCPLCPGMTKHVEKTSQWALGLKSYFPNSAPVGHAGMDPGSCKALHEAQTIQ